jgi:type IV pilus assembly protein PilM
LTEERKKKKEIAAANQLLAVIRGEKASIEVEPVEAVDASAGSARPEPVLLTEEKARSHRSFSFFAKRTVGLDVGSHSVKCVHLEKRGFNRVELVHAEAVEIPPEERDLAGEDGTGAKVNAIKRLMESTGSPRPKIVSAVGGVSTAIRQIELPKMSGKELSSSVKLWARNYIPFDVNEVQLDYQVFGFDKSTRKIRLLLVAVIKDYIQQHIELLHQANVDPMLVDINPLAVMNALLFNEEFRDDQSIIVLDVGDRNTTLCIYSETDPYFVRNLMVSGSDFTRDIQRKLGLPYGDAERYKRGEVALPEKKAEPQRLIEIIGPSLEALIKEVRRSLTYYENQTRTRGFSEIVLTGGSAEMDGLADLLGGELGLPVRILNPFRHVETRDLSLPGPSSQYSLALGLALREST